MTDQQPATDRQDLRPRPAHGAADIDDEPPPLQPRGAQIKSPARRWAAALPPAHTPPTAAQPAPSATTPRSPPRTRHPPPHRR